MESDEDDWSPLDYWEFYATEAWKADSEEVEVPEDVLADIRSRWDAFGDERQQKIYEAMRMCSECSSEVQNLTGLAEESRTTYQGHEDDSDVYGEDHPTRPTFSTYRGHEEALLDGTQKYRAAFQKLVVLLDDGRLKSYLQDLIADLEESVDEIAHRIRDELPLLEASANQKVAERERKASGRLGSGWTGSWPVGVGTYAAPRVWVKQNASGIIVDRVVIKDTQLDKDRWEYFGMWTQGGRSGNVTVPSEVQALYSLRGLIGSSSIIKIRNWRMQSSLYRHRQYLEYCPLGDLDRLISGEGGTYSYLIQARRLPENKERDLLATSRFIPEPFIWYCFLRLVQAGILMERGELASHGMLPWSLIVHRDFKWQNILLGVKGDKEFPGYPEPKLADFGLCLILPPNDKTPSEDYLAAGTPGVLAPEQWKGLKNADGSMAHVSSKTNVWGVGIVMWSLVSCDEDALADHFEFAAHDADRKKDHPRRVPPPFDASARQFYSKALLDLIRLCTAYRDTERPSFDDILKDIDKHTIGEHDCAHGMRSRSADLKKFEFRKGKGFGLPEWLKDRWAVGKELKPLYEKSPPEQGSAGEPDSRYPAPPVHEPPSQLGDDFGGFPGAEIGAEPRASRPPHAPKPGSKRKSVEHLESRASKRRSQTAGDY